MKKIIPFLLFLLVPCFVTAAISAGIGKAAITPPVGTPSAGYEKRMGAGMEGVHDPLLAIALALNNEKQTIVFCSVDHLGFTHEMVQQITEKVHLHPDLEHVEIYIGSSHTHSGGGAYLHIPVIGEILAGAYDPHITSFYIQQTVQAIVEACHHLTPVKVGIGYGHAEDLSFYRGQWPQKVTPSACVTVIKVTKLDDSPFAVLFNYPMHPTVLDETNFFFSADFVGSTRKHFTDLLKTHVEVLYFNGAQGDIIPKLPKGGDRFIYCEKIGASLAQTVADIWKETTANTELEITTQKDAYSFIPQPTPFGLKLPLDQYDSELNLIVLNEIHAFITIPGELSTLYDQRFQQKGYAAGFSHVSVFGLVNDAHGYIILPDAWRHKTKESALSFGGEWYGDEIESKVNKLLDEAAILNHHFP